MIYRTKNKKLLVELSKQYFETQPKILIEAFFQASCTKPSQLTIQCCGQQKDFVTVTGEIAQPAKTQPMTKERIQMELAKLGDTLFELKEAQIELEEAVFFPIGSLKELRRKALDNLTEQIIKQFHRESPKKTQSKSMPLKTRLTSQKEKQIQTACVMTLEQLEVVCDDERISEVYLDITDFEIKKISDAEKLCVDNKKRFFLALPHIFRAKTYDFYCFTYSIGNPQRLFLIL